MEASPAFLLVLAEIQGVLKVGVVSHKLRQEPNANDANRRIARIRSGFFAQGPELRIHSRNSSIGDIRVENPPGEESRRSTLRTP